jgi:hypothetical protein
MIPSAGLRTMRTVSVGIRLLSVIAASNPALPLPTITTRLMTAIPFLLITKRSREGRAQYHVRARTSIP